jgi:hypothetical protein
VVLTGLAVAAVVAAVILATNPGGAHPASNGGGSGSAGSSRHAASKSHTASSSSGSNPSSSGGSTSAPLATSAPSASSSGSTSGPVTAVESFYHRAAAHEYSAAWELADPAFRDQLGGYQSFAAGQSGDRSITFDSADVTSQSGNAATVYVRTTSVRDNGTQHCSGPVNLVRGSSGWLLHQISINCT